MHQRRRHEHWLDYWQNVLMKRWNLWEHRPSDDQTKEKPCHWHGFNTAWLQGNDQIFPDSGINGVTFGEIHLIFVNHVGI